MVGHFSLLTTLPTSTVDMTAEFAPLLIGMCVVLGMCVLGLITVSAIYDAKEAKRTLTQESETELSLPKAA